MISFAVSPCRRVAVSLLLCLAPLCAQYTPPGGGGSPAGAAGGSLKGTYPNPGLALADGMILVGDGTNTGQPVTPSGDLVMDDTGVFTLNIFGSPPAGSSFSGLVGSFTGGACDSPSCLSNLSSTGSGNAVFATGPTLTNPVVGTQSANDNSTKAASTAYADRAASSHVSNPNGWGMWTLTVPNSSFFSWLNQSTASLVSGTNFLSIAAPGTSGTNLRVQHKSCNNGSPWTDLYALVLIGGQIGANPAGFIEVDDGTKLVGIGYNPNGGSTSIFTVTWASVTSGSVGLNSSTFTQPVSLIPIWFHVGNNAGTLSFHYSADGVGTPGTSGGWVTLTASTSGNLSAVTNCGFGINANGNTADITLLSYSFGNLVAQ